MAWRGRLGEAGDSGLELSLGLPAYFAKPSGLDAGEAPGDAAAFALQAGKGNDASDSKARLVPDVSEFVHSRPRALISLFPF